VSRLVPLAAALCAVLALAAPSGSAGAAAPVTLLPGSHVGRLAGTRAYVGLSLHGGTLRAYVCDGTPGRAATLTRWFGGRWDGRHARTFTAQGVQLRVQAVRPDGTIAGRVRAFSGPHGFELRPARGRAGLYESTDAGRRLHAGWVVLPDGSLRGAMVSTRKPCRFVLVSGPNGSQQWVSVC
jgi:hypothetical protein